MYTWFTTSYAHTIFGVSLNERNAHAKILVYRLRTSTDVDVFFFNPHSCVLFDFSFVRTTERLWKRRRNSILDHQGEEEWEPDDNYSKTVRLSIFSFATMIENSFSNSVSND